MSDATALSALSYPVFADRLPARVLQEGKYEVRFARTAEELDAVLRLRFRVFNLELGEGLDASWETGCDVDEFDPVCHHLIVVYRPTGEIVGTYRLQTSAMAAVHRGFYSDGEFVLSDLPEHVIRDSVELGRACVVVEHRNTPVLLLLWKGLALYVAHNQARFLFGCCSLTSQDPVEGRAVMDHLVAKGHVHPELALRPRPGLECYGPELVADPGFPVKVPKLFRIYLRHGAKVCGPPAIDRQFKTIDYLVVFDVAAMDPRQVRTFFG